MIYGYTLFLPLGLWAFLKWSGSEAAALLEMWALYGYANLIWIPVSLISWSTLDILNYVFVGVGFAISVLFLVRNLYPVISSTPKQRAKILLVLVVVLQFGLAVAIKILFFANTSLANKGKDGKDGGLPESKPGKGDESDSDGEGERLRRLLMF